MCENLHQFYKNHDDQFFANRQIFANQDQDLYHQIIFNRNIELQDYTFADDRKNYVDITSEIDFIESQNHEEVQTDPIFITPELEFFVDLTIMLQEHKEVEDSCYKKEPQNRKVFIVQDTRQILDPVSSSPDIIENIENIEKFKIDELRSESEDNKKIEINCGNNLKNPEIGQRKMITEVKEKENNQEGSYKVVKKIKKRRAKKRKSMKVQGAELKQKIRIRNETKNIIKNLGKEIIRFVNEKQIFITEFLKAENSNISYDGLNSELQRNFKHSMSKIEHLRNLWTNEFFGKEMRYISLQFLRKHCYHWIFNSRVQDFKSLLKYRHRLESAISNPQTFMTLKWP